MANITLTRLTLDNFKGCRHFEFAPMGENVTIAGDNATGKTTILDGWLWLLWGKDSRGRKDFDIKPLDENGNVADHDAITAVTAELSVDGTPRSLKRTYAEKWTTRRGRAEPVFDGHESEYYVDQVPVKKNAFDEAVAGLADEEHFRLLTSVTWFPEQMKWQDRRALLFSLAGIQSDEEIMETDSRFQPLIEALGGRSVADYRKILSAKRKGLVTTKTDLPARMDEQAMIVKELDRIDFGSLRAQRQAMAGRVAEKDQALTVLKSEDPTAALRLERAELEAKGLKLDAENQIFRAGQTSDTSGRDAIRRSIADLTLAIDQKNASVKALEADMEHYKGKVEGYRMDWLAENAVEFDAPDTCPTCGQKLPKTRMEAARKSFEKSKAEKLRAIEAAGEEANDRIDRIHEQIETEKQAAAELFAKRNQREAELAAIPEAAPVEDLPDYAAKKAEIVKAVESLDGKIQAARKPKKTAEETLIREIDGIRQDMEQLSAAIAQETRLNAARQRIEELRNQAVTASKALEELDGMLFLMEDFSRYKAEFVEESVNGMFDCASFRLFREQINGGLEECCDVVFQGIPYGSLNNGARINIGIDIIKTISQKTGVTVPLFVDNAESVTALWPSGSQQIRLVVDENAKELTIR